MNKLMSTYCTLLTLTLAVAASAGTALANTAANTQIVNTATLTYTGGSKQASVTVAVALVPVQPNIFLNGNTAGYTGINTPVLGDSLILTSASNGPATYHVTALIGSSGAQLPQNTTGSSVSDGGGFDVSLGATVTTVGATVQSGGNTLVIPAPDASHITGAGPSGWVVNGIGTGSAIKFSTFSRNVTGVTLNADGNYTITFDGAAIAPVGAGTPVFETKTVSGITALPGTIVTLGTEIDVYAQATVTTTGVAAITSNWADNKWASSPASVLLTKYVRNLTASGNPTSGPCFTGKTTFTVNTSSNDFYTCGVTGKSGDILEYVLFASNTSTTSDLTNTALSDVLPTSYVTFTGSAYGGGDVFYSADGTGSGNTTFTAAAAGANQASITPWPIPTPNPSSVTLTVNVGTGATSTTSGTLGKEVGGLPTSVFIAYRVTIK